MSCQKFIKYLNGIYIRAEQLKTTKGQYYTLNTYLRAEL
jgi:hypothetical protein